MDNAIALDARRSVVVEACAGSGKTWLLVSRIVRLLLAGAQPSEILAITFTRKAAQEMRSRLHQWLYQLASEDEAVVRRFLAERGLSEPTVAELQRARSLYRTVMLAQPGVTISTFHGWFMQVMQRAPLNADVMQGMQLVERAGALQDEAWETFVDELRQHPQSPTSQQMQWLFKEYGLSNTRALLTGFLDKRAEWAAYLASSANAGDPLSFALGELQACLAVDLAFDYAGNWGVEAGNREAVFAFSSRWAANGTATQKNKASELERAWSDSPAAERFSAVWPLLFTQANQPRSINSTKNQDEPAFLRARDSLQSSVQAVRDALAGQHIYRLNQAVLECGTVLLSHYQQLKQQGQRMDFADLEWQVCRLMQQSEHAATMQYKLDCRYRHLLLDEFQDTNPLQWQIMRSWFGASLDAGNPPTVFLVGDPKQSIYRFRRADARLFGEARDYLMKHFGAATLQKNHTRRNSPDILSVVNALFSPHPSGFDSFEPHAAHHQMLPGRVEVLPLALAPEASAQEDGSSLRNPLERARAVPAQGARQREAEQFARTLREIVENGQVEDESGQKRAARYGDVMVLVRSRTHLAVYEAALRVVNIPFLSSRRGGLLDTLESRDVYALLVFLITPFADLALAQVLRSPVFSCGDEDLMSLAQAHALAEGEAWWLRLKALAQPSPALQRARDLLQNWIELADRLPVHDLLDRIYFEGDVLARYHATTPLALRAKVAANLQAFMALSLSMNAGRYPSLPRFLEELRELRDSDEDAPDEGKLGVAGNAVRIYTVHESKGLEAPIVCLLDANAMKDAREGYGVLLDWPVDSERPVHFSVFADVASRGKQRAPLFEADQKLQAREEMNLLYVAMTRAKQVLLVSGHGKDAAAEQKKTAPSWYDRVKQAVAEVGQGGATFGKCPAQLTAPAHVENKLVSNALDPLLVEAPSNHLSRLPPIIPVGERRIKLTPQQQRGIWLHRMLEGMTGDVSVQVDELGIPSAEIDTLSQQAQQLIALPHLARFFDVRQYRVAYNEMAYINAAGELKRIDRLVEFENEVWILDYKLSDAHDISRYRMAMKEYWLAMQSVYDKPVYCALLFSDGVLHDLTASF